MSALKLAVFFATKQTPARSNGEANLLFTASAEQTDHLPFASLLLGTSAHLKEFDASSCAGLYLISERNILNQPLSELSADQLPGCVGMFPMIAKPNMDRTAADQYWRDVHAPLALEVHSAMTHYYQLTFVHRFFGPDLDGLALCCFAHEKDFRERMYSSAEGKQRIGEDIVKFADTARSPRKVVATVRPHTA